MSDPDAMCFIDPCEGCIQKYYNKKTFQLVDCNQGRCELMWWLWYLVVTALDFVCCNVINE